MTTMLLVLLLFGSIRSMTKRHGGLAYLRNNVKCLQKLPNKKGSGEAAVVVGLLYSNPLSYASKLFNFFISHRLFFFITETFVVLYQSKK